VEEISAGSKTEAISWSNLIRRSGIEMKNSKISFPDVEVLGDGVASSDPNNLL
jgi:hypothetical protein